jgi:hypothetical protein
VSAAIPEWKNEVASLGVEDDIIFSGGKATFADGRQDLLYIIR